uniref:Uncharacterized protein n=1 Tax=Rhizophora mucronata TaxID=61149 RepID=A0A2P2Q6N1_RHIMU
MVGIISSEIRLTCEPFNFNLLLFKVELLLK